MGTQFRMKPVTAAVVLACASQSAQAFETIEFANGAALETRINMTYTLSARMEDRDDLLAAASGSNDGNNNFDDGSLTSNRVAFLFDGKLSKRLGGAQELGAVLSATAFTDYSYQTSNDNDPGNGLPGAGFNPNGVNKKPRFNEFTSQAEFYHGGYGRLLDAYVYGSFDIGSTRLSARLGRQVVNWGEALFFPSIGLAQGPSDGTKAVVPGTEVKEILLPEDQVSLSFEATPDWSLLAHWQFQFQETLSPAPGSYFNTSDSVGPGGRCLTPWTSVAPIAPLGFGVARFDVQSAPGTRGRKARKLGPGRSAEAVDRLHEVEQRALGQILRVHDRSHRVAVSQPPAHDLPQAEERRAAREVLGSECRRAQLGDQVDDFGIRGAHHGRIFLLTGGWSPRSERTSTLRSLR